MEISKKKNLTIMFLGSLVPNTPEFQNPAFSLSGNLVQEGVVDGLLNQQIQVDIISSQPMPSFPKSKLLICKSKKIHYKNKTIIRIIPSINILFIREFLRGIFAFISIIKWSYKNKYKKRCVLQYGVYTPPTPMVYLACKITKSKYVSILYDLGIPPKNLKLGLIRTMIYHLVEYSSKKIIPIMDGRIIITENIKQDYARNKHCLLIDGGISDTIISRLFDLEKNNKTINETIFLCAGALWPINGTRVILNAMKTIENPSVKVWFAGQGIDLPIIQQAEKIDNRIKYLGMLNLDQLFSYYEKADVLLNIRVDKDEALIYLFPSKFFEYLATGKYVVTTKVGHLEKEYGHLCAVLPNYTSESLSEKMEYISSIPKSELYKKGEEARKFMIENRTWNKRSMEISNYIINII